RSCRMPPEQPFEGRNVFEDSQGRRIGVDVAAPDRLDERADAVRRRPEPVLEPPPELLVEDVDELALAALALAASAVGIGGEEPVMLLEGVEQRVDPDVGG